MSCQATIVIPTFDHGPTLRRSVASALGQTVREIEVVVIGDGVPDATREIMAGLVSGDARVRFLDNPKHQSRGEPHRHAAIKESRGHMICYLSDDDLYLPNHVELVIDLLRSADFVHAMPVYVDGDGRPATHTVDLNRPEHQRLIANVGNRIPLSAGAHSREAYDRLAHGWRTPPAGIPSDLFMWRQFLADDRCRFASATEPTVLVFRSPLRRGWTLDQRIEELDRWRQRLGCPDGYAAFVNDLLAAKVREAAESDCRCLALERDAEQFRARAACVEATFDQERQSLDEARRALQAAQTMSACDRERLERYHVELADMQNRLAQFERRPEATALRFVSGLRRIRHALLRLRP